jgi:hypothetical protein
MKDRFDLENEIMTLNNLAENLGTISEGILEHGLSNDEVVNAIEGVRILLQLQSNKLMDTMCQCLKLDEYKDCSNSCGGCNR